MVGDRHGFDVLMVDAHRAMLTLDNVMVGGASRAIVAAVRDGLRVYSQLVDYRQTERMSAAESSQLQNALDLIRSRLRFFGEAV
jgi:hypothetical protein